MPQGKKTATKKTVVVHNKNIVSKKKTKKTTVSTKLMNSTLLNNCQFEAYCPLFGAGK